MSIDPGEPGFGDKMDTEFHGYVLFLNLNLSSSHWNALRDAFRVIGPSDDPQPSKRPHSLARLDDQAEIFESGYALADVLETRFKILIAQVFGILPRDIESRSRVDNYGDFETTVVTYFRGATDFLEIAAFGGAENGRGQSYNECHGYLVSNTVEWGGATP